MATTCDDITAILEEIEINRRVGADHRFSEAEWIVIENALRASLPNQAGNPSRDELERLPKEILTAWRSRFPNNMYAWPGAPEEFAIEAVKVFAARLAAKPADEGVREAWQWLGGMLPESAPDWIAEASEPTASGLAAPILTGGLTVLTTRGKQRAKVRDWIVRINGEIYLLTESAYAALSSTGEPKP